MSVHDYPKYPIGKGNPYWRCSACGISDPQINGRIEGHLESCSWRIAQCVDDTLNAANMLAKITAERDLLLNEKESWLEGRQTQRDVDLICWYRNLAIHLGAKPTDMQGKFDRQLCEHGFDEESKKDIDWQRCEETQTWEDLEKAEKELAESEAHASRMRDAVLMCQDVFSKALADQQMRCLHDMLGHNHDVMRWLEKCIIEIDAKF